MSTQLKPKSKKISVLIPSYNQQDCILDILNSIEVQSLHPMEIVIRDDQSLDNTYEFVKNFANKSSLNIRLYRNEVNLGIYKNIDKLYNDSLGQVNCILGADDLFYEDCFFNLEEHLKKNSLDGHKTKFLTITNFNIQYPGNGKRMFNNYQHKNSNIFSFILREDLGWRGFGVSTALTKSVGSWESLRNKYSLLDFSADQIVNIEEFVNAEKIFFCNFISSTYIAGTGSSNIKKNNEYKTVKRLNHIIRKQYSKYLSRRDLKYLKYRDSAASFSQRPGISNFIKSLMLYMLNIFNFGKNNNWLIQAKYILPHSFYLKFKKLFHGFFR